MCATPGAAIQKGTRHYANPLPRFSREKDVHSARRIGDNQEVPSRARDADRQLELSGFLIVLTLFGGRSGVQTLSRSLRLCMSKSFEKALTFFNDILGLKRNFAPVIALIYTAETAGHSNLWNKRV